MKAPFRETLEAGIAALGLAVGEASVEKLERFADLLLRWNRRVGLTAVTDPAELAEKHLVDSLALLRVLGAAGSVLDLGSGAGLPGIPLAVARPGLAVTCCDSAARKVAFVKAAAAALDVPVRAVAVRAAGEPEREGLPCAELVVSRALADPARWLPLGSRYLAPGGRVVAMLGRDPGDPALEELARANGLTLTAVDRFALPRSGASRANAVFRVA